MSAGGGSALLYAMLFLSGYQFSIDDLKNYGKLNSKTPSYPEITTMGVDASTGCLGEGFGTIVGMALAEKILSEKFNKKPKNKFDKKTKKLIDYLNAYWSLEGDDLNANYFTDFVYSLHFYDGIVAIEKKLRDKRYIDICQQASIGKLSKF